MMCIWFFFFFNSACEKTGGYEQGGVGFILYRGRKLLLCVVSEESCAYLRGVNVCLCLCVYVCV